MRAGSLRSAAVAQLVSAHHLITPGPRGSGSLKDTGEKKRRRDCSPSVWRNCVNCCQN
ncbi:hypothetical protein XNW1_2390010 [Xenorhabdus nematophila str. Websteri]|nr:hypothetical protein XNW1_2390010 [Xenorhabdus nematophila str. Websteri]